MKNVKKSYQWPEVFVWCMSVSIMASCSSESKPLVAWVHLPPLSQRFFCQIHEQPLDLLQFSLLPSHPVPPPLRYSMPVRSTTWANGTSWQRISQMSKFDFNQGYSFRGIVFQLLSSVLVPPHALFSFNSF